MISANERTQGDKRLKSIDLHESHGAPVTSVAVMRFATPGVGGGGVLGLRTFGEVPLENLKSYPLLESNS